MCKDFFVHLLLTTTTVTIFAVTQQLKFNLIITSLLITIPYGLFRSYEHMIEIDDHAKRLNNRKNFTTQIPRKKNPFHEILNQADPDEDNE